MKTKFVPLLLALCLFGSGCATITRGVLHTVNWGFDLTFYAVELGFGVVTAPFDRAALFKSGAANIRATVVRPLVALERSLSGPRRVRIIVLWKQADGSLARSFTEIVDGVPQGTYFDAFYVDAESRPPPEAKPVRNPVEVVMSPVIIQNSDVEHIVIDEKAQKLTVEEVKPMMRPTPNLPAARLSEDAINWLKKLGASEGGNITLQ